MYFVSKYKVQIYKVNTIKDNIFVQIENQMLIVLSTNDIDKMILF